MDRVELLKTLRVVRRLARANPPTTAEARLATIADIATGKLSATDALKPSVLAAATRKKRGGRDRMDRGGLDRAEE